MGTRPARLISIQPGTRTMTQCRLVEHQSAGSIQFGI
jgi:hypothetical protein